MEDPMPLKSTVPFATTPTTMTQPARGQDCAVIAAAEQWARSLEQLHLAERRSTNTAAEEEALVVAVTELYDAICARQGPTSGEAIAPLLTFIEPMGNA